MRSCKFKCNVRQTFFFFNKRTYLAPITSDNIIAGDKTDEKKKKIGKWERDRNRFNVLLFIVDFIIIMPRLAINKQSLLLSKEE